MIHRPNLREFSHGNRRSGSAGTRQFRLPFRRIRNPQGWLAEREGFEPSVPVTQYARISNLVTCRIRGQVQTVVSSSTKYTPVALGVTARPKIRRRRTETKLPRIGMKKAS